jgi:hydroxymethylbilane synthase
MDEMKKRFPNCTFEIVNFETKGDKILNIALPKIGDKGLFTKELEDALENGSIDFVVHSLKDMPCQTLPNNLIIAAIPKREDPRDALVVAKRWQNVKFDLADFDENSVIGTSSLRRVAQLKNKYPKLKFESVRGNLQTRFAKLDDELEKKYDAIILAVAGLKRLNYDERITKILNSDQCFHAVSQGALGIECRRDDLLMIRMLNELNHEETLLRCIAERTFLAALEGGCSAPIGVNSRITESNTIQLEGLVIDLNGENKIEDSFEMSLDSIALTASLDCPVFSVNDLLRYQEERKQESEETMMQENKPNTSFANNLKRTFSANDDPKSDSSLVNKKINKDASEENDQLANDEDEEVNITSYSYIVDLKIDRIKMSKAELCGLHLAEKLKEKGADVLISEMKAQLHKSL